MERTRNGHLRPCLRMTSVRAIYHRGDVVLVFYPFTNGVGGKRRPAIVVQTNDIKYVGADTILALISSRKASSLLRRTHWEVPLQSEAGKASGLLMDSVVRCELLMTLEQSLIARKIGRSI